MSTKSKPLSKRAFRASAAGDASCSTQVSRRASRSSTTDRSMRDRSPRSKRCFTLSCGSLREHERNRAQGSPGERSAHLKQGRYPRTSVSNPVFTVECRVGRVVEARLMTLRDADDVTQFEMSMRAAFMRLRRKCVICADVRAISLLSPTVLDLMIGVLANGNPHLERSAILLPVQGAAFHLQAERSCVSPNPPTHLPQAARHGGMARRGPRRGRARRGSGVPLRRQTSAVSIDGVPPGGLWARDLLHARWREAPSR